MDKTLYAKAFDLMETYANALKVMDCNSPIYTPNKRKKLKGYQKHK